MYKHVFVIGIMLIKSYPKTSIYKCFLSFFQNHGRKSGVWKVCVNGNGKSNAILRAHKIKVLLVTRFRYIYNEGNDDINIILWSAYYYNFKDELFHLLYGKMIYGLIGVFQQKKSLNPYFSEPKSASIIHKFSALLHASGKICVEPVLVLCCTQAAGRGGGGR